MLQGETVPKRRKGLRKEREIVESSLDRNASLGGRFLAISSSSSVHRVLYFCRFRDDGGRSEDRRGPP